MLVDLDGRQALSWKWVLEALFKRPQDEMHNTR